jgi:hypothetical protein
MKSVLFKAMKGRQEEKCGLMMMPSGKYFSGGGGRKWAGFKKGIPDSFNLGTVSILARSARLSCSRAQPC